MSKMTNIAMISGCLMVAAAGALAQDAGSKAEEQRRNAEMMKPQTNQPERTPQTPSRPASEADQKAEEMRKNSEMMKPQTSRPAAGRDRPGASSPASEADRKAAQEREKAQRMKPQ